MQFALDHSNDPRARRGSSGVVAIVVISSIVVVIGDEVR
jgi:hypothetical protein